MSHHLLLLFPPRVERYLYGVLVDGERCNEKHDMNTLDMCIFERITDHCCLNYHPFTVCESFPNVH